jgi:hypothetical protein
LCEGGTPLPYHLGSAKQLFLGDVANPRGGVRGVIPAKKNY